MDVRGAIEIVAGKIYQFLWDTKLIAFEIQIHST